MASNDSDEENLEQWIERELEDLDIEVEDFNLESSEVEHIEVEEVVGVGPGEDRVETVRQKMVTEDGDRFTVVVKKRLQCPSCGRIMVEEPVAPGSYPECGEDFWEE